MRYFIVVDKADTRTLTKVKSLKQLHKTVGPKDVHDKYYFLEVPSMEVGKEILNKPFTEEVQLRPLNKLDWKRPFINQSVIEKLVTAQ